MNWWNTSPAVLSHWFCVAISLIMHLVSYYAINQSIDQSIDQSINHSTINQPTSQWINQSTTQSINQSINQSITQSTNQCISLTGAEMAVLANKLGYEKEVVRVWFCNRRQALKNASKRFKSDNSESSTATSWAFTKRLRIQYSYQLSFHKEEVHLHWRKTEIPRVLAVVNLIQCFHSLRTLPVHLHAVHLWSA